MWGVDVCVWGVSECGGWGMSECGGECVWGGSVCVCVCHCAYVHVYMYMMYIQ